MRSIAVAAICCGLASCNSSGGGEGNIHDITQDSQLERLQTQIYDLQSEVRDLKNTSTSVGVFSESSDGWQWVNADPSKLRVGLIEISPHGNGSMATFSVMNPNAMSLRDCSGTLTWWSADETGSVIQSTMHNRRADFDGSLPPGTFSSHKFPLGDIPPEKLASVTIGGIDCTRTNGG